MTKRADFVIVGAGVMGLSVARAIRLAQPKASLLILEKEAALGAHASGRNSGVMHAGIYYPPETMKARFCADGSRRMRDYCESRALPVKQYGKLIVPLTAEEDHRLDALADRAIRNGASVEIVDAQSAREIEPEAFCFRRALYSPKTACIDPVATLNAMARELREGGNAEILFESAFESVDTKARSLATKLAGSVEYGTLINAAGAYADVVAKPYGCGSRYRTLPFRGSYLEVDSASGLDIRGYIYPVPNPELPFLGVHFTRGVSGKIYVGPTAIPALGREHYFGLKGISTVDTWSVAAAVSRLFWRNEQGFRGHVYHEARHLLRSGFHAAAQKMVPNLKQRDLNPSKKRGIRPQLFDTATGKLEMDFVIERGESSLHILNAISPGFTCALPFADFVVKDWLKI